MDQTTSVAERMLTPHQFLRKHLAKGTGQLLEAREASGLKATLAARSMFCIVGIVLVSLNSQSGLEYKLTIPLMGAVLVLNLIGYFKLKRGVSVAAIGLGGAILDVVMLFLLPLIWYKSVGGHAVPMAYMTKTMAPMVMLVFIAINALTIRARYPLIVTGGSVAILTLIGLLVMADPRTRYSDNLLEVFLGGKVSLTMWFAGVVLIVALVGLLISFVTRVARRTVLVAGELEQANAEMRETHSRVVLEEQMAALTRLAAGVSHEVNNPLGAVSSSADLTKRSVKRLRELLDQAGDLKQLRDDNRLERVLSSLEQTSETNANAGSRLREFIGKLRQLAHLERGPLQLSDVHLGIDSTLQLLRSQWGERVTVVKEYARLPEIRCDPGRLNQVFNTIFQNASDAMPAGGTLTVRTSTSNGSVAVEISDTGGGIDPKDIAKLFEIGFSKGQHRVRAGLGLPIARSIVQQHGGTIEVSSEINRGSTFRVELPVGRPVTETPAIGDSPGTS